MLFSPSTSMLCLCIHDLHLWGLSQLTFVLPASFLLLCHFLLTWRLLQLTAYVTSRQSVLSSHSWRFYITTKTARQSINMHDVFLKKIMWFALIVGKQQEGTLVFHISNYQNARSQKNKDELFKKNYWCVKVHFLISKFLRLCLCLALHLC